MQTASTLINDFTPAQRALLHACITFFKNNTQQAFTETIEKNKSPLYKLFYSYTTEQLNELEQRLFAECFIDDLDFVKHFNELHATAYKVADKILC